MGTDTAKYLWARLRELLQNVPSTRADQALLIGRLIAWHCLPADILPEAARVPSDLTTVSSDQVCEAWITLEQTESIGFRRFAFSRAASFPYESLSDEVLRQICQEAIAILLLTPQARTAFADLVFEAFEDEGLAGIPVEIADLSLRLLQLMAGKEVACIGSVVDSLAVVALRLKLQPFLLCNSPPVVASLYGIISGANQQEVAHLNPFGVSGQKLLAKRLPTHGVVIPGWGQVIQSNAVSTVMPSRFGVQSHEALALELASTCLSERAVVVVPNGVLFNRGRESALREHLVRDGRVSAVVSFPSGLLRQAAIPFNLVLLRAPSNDHSVRFFQIDETTHLTGRGKLRVHQRRFVGAEDVVHTILEPLKPPFGLPRFAIAKELAIQSQDYILVPLRYFIAPREFPSLPLTKLAELVEIIKPQFLPTADDDDEAEIYEVIPGDLPDYGYLEDLRRTRTVKSSALKSRSKQILQKNDVLLSSKGTIGRVGIVGDLDVRVPALASQSLLILRSREGKSPVDPRYLLMFLKSPLAQRMIKSLAVGATVSNISLAEIRALSVALPSTTDQQTIIEAFEGQIEIQHEIRTLQDKQKLLAVNAWKDVCGGGQESDEVSGGTIKDGVPSEGLE